MKPTLLRLSLAVTFALANVVAVVAVAFLASILPIAWRDVPTPRYGTFGVDLSARDIAVKPGDDFNRYASGHWLDTYQLDDGEVSYDLGDELNYEINSQKETIIQEFAKRDHVEPGSEEQQVRDYYASFMNTSVRDAAGITPLKPLLAKIGGIDTTAKLIAAFGDAAIDGTSSPIGMGVGLDPKNPDRYLVNLGVGGLGLPDRDYYFNTTARFVVIRAAYVMYIQKMLGFAGVPEADTLARAEAVLALESALAKPMWDRARRRDVDQTYNLTSFADLYTLYPGYDWGAHATKRGLGAPVEINVRTPSAIRPVLAIVNNTPLTVWRDYLMFHAIDTHAPLLSKEIGDAEFAFFATALEGQKSQSSLERRGASLAEESFGDAFGKIYIENHFSPETKSALDEMVTNIRGAMRHNLARADWMGDATKAEAYRKLDAIRPRIGSPTKWSDYSGIKIVPDNLIANEVAIRKYYINDQNSRLGLKPDREEWSMTPQTVNAYYTTSFNEIVLPAAILQPPYFDPLADPAVNYGGIGAIIGHEISHAFDDQGSKSDFAGIQRNWWGDQDRANFESKANALGAQYDGFCPLRDTCVNGAQTMGENISDLGGLSIAYAAYHMSLKGEPAPVINGLTGDQRFFLAFAQIWRTKYRDEALVNTIETDSHSPPQYRVNGPVRNLDAWYVAFDVKPGDKMYLAPNERVRIW